MKAFWFLFAFFNLLNLKSAFSSDFEISEQIVFLTNRTHEMEHFSIDSAYQFASRTYKNNSDIKVQLEALNLMFRLNVKKGDYLSALNNVQLSSSLIEKYSINEYKLTVLTNMGIVYRAVSLPSKSLEYYFKALNEYSLSPIEECNLKYYIGLIFFDLGYLEECQDYIKESVTIGLKNNLKEQLVSSYLTLSTTFENKDSIQFYLDKASMVLKEFDEFSLYEERIALYNKRALLCESLEDYNNSKQSYQSAISIASKMNFKFHLCTLYNNYAYLMMEESKIDSSKYYLQMALAIAQDIKSLEMEYEIYDTYSDFFEYIGDFRNSLRYKNLYIEKYNEYMRKQNHERSQILSAAFESDQKEKEILKKANQLKLYGIYLIAILFILAISILVIFYFQHRLKLNQSRMEIENKRKALEIADAVIEGQDLERQRLAMDLHDGLAPQIASIRYYLQGSIKDHEVLDVIRKNLDQIHQNIRDLSHRMLPPILEDAGLVFTLKTIVNTLNKSNEIRINFDSDLDERLPSKLENNLYFLISELINNAVKHSEGDEVTVQLSKNNNQLIILVEDNGGNFNIEKSKDGLGMKNIKQRLDYLGGTLHNEFSREATIFLINVPL